MSSTPGKKFYDEGFPSRRTWAKVKICVDFPGAEGIYVSCSPVREDERLSDVLDDAKARMLESFIQDAAFNLANRGASS